MGKKILYIVLGALVVFGLLFLLWKIFFGGAGNAPGQGGPLGSAGNATSTLGGGANNNNGQTPLGNNTNTNGQVPLGSNASGGYNAQGVYVGAGGAYNAQGTYVGTGSGTIGTGGTIGIGTGSTTGLTAPPPGVTWLGSPFNPAGINSVSSGVSGFAPTILTPPDTNSSNNLLTVLAGTAIAGALSCALQAGLVTSSTASATAIPPPPPNVLVNGNGPLIVADYGVRAGAVGNAVQNTGKNQISFVGCIVNTIAKTALQAITASVVNWINSGFKGQPSFISNYQQFFTNVADLAAGQFIQGAGLSFLCSPFKLQIKIAVAQSYANRNTAASCSLTKVISNINGFMNGNFSQGGWGGLVSFTTIPTNNPYGAFAYAQVGLANAQSNALTNARNNISPTGFLNLQQRSCPNGTGITGGAANSQAAQVACPPGCTCKITTPGTLIEGSLQSVVKSPIDQLGLANSLDQIISALTTQLMTRLLQNGLSSLSQPTTQSPADIAAQSQAVSLLTDMQNRTTLAQQIGTISQGSIGDIESAQSGLNSLANCWSSIAAASSTQSAAAAQKAAAANDKLLSLNDSIDHYNNVITQMNSVIATLNQFQSQISLAASAAEVASVGASYNAAVASGAFPAQADVTTAQQDRTTLQSQMADINQSTQTGLAQCRAAANQ